jgi:hypothetical protein
MLELRTRITADEMRVMRRTVKYAWMKCKRNKYILKELNLYWTKF